MRKIPTLFQRNPEDMRNVTRDVHPDCQWVLDGEGVATRKYDGTCVLYDLNGQWWARREVKPGKKTPPNYQPIETDPNTGKTVGWEPVEQSAFAKYHAEALENRRAQIRPGTYELCGPKVNGNPERFAYHMLVRHEDAERVSVTPDFASLAVWLHGHDWEGIVWHHPDGRMAKLKRRDFPS